MIVFEPVQAAIWHCLNHYAYSDAVFLAERLYAEVESDDSLFLLATSYYRWGKPHQAYSLLKDKPSITRHPQCRFLLAKCANDLQRYAEAEKVISGNALSSQINLEHISMEFGDQASFALQLLAKIFAKSERTADASESYLKALKLNPFLWSCFMDLCNLGEKPEPSQLFQLSSLSSFSTCHGSSINNIYNDLQTPDHPEQLQQQPNNINLVTPAPQYCYTSPVLNSTPMVDIISPMVQINHARVLMFGSLDCDNLTPTFGVYPLDTSTPYNDSSGTNALLMSTGGSGTATINGSQNALTDSNDQKSLAKRVRQHVGQFMSRRDAGGLHCNKPILSSSSNISMSTPVSGNVQNVRRSSRLFSNSNSVKENNKSPNRDKFVTPKSPSRKTKQRLAKANLNKTTFNDMNVRNLQQQTTPASGTPDIEKTETITAKNTMIDNKIANNNLINNNNNNATNQSYLNQQAAINLQKHCAEGLMDLFRQFGVAYQHLSQFNCRKAIECLHKLPTHHFNTSWVLSTLALAYFELNEYEHAVVYFKEVHDREPYRFDFMEIYSTALWHLQKEVELSALAQNLQILDKNNPVTWCVAGNCFSLQKEHDTAIKLFQRAVQIDPTFTYAYNLLGHEYVTTEELDKAMGCFRSAIRLDPRHYKAWFGIATVYSKQELFTLAEYHYKRALAINPHSSVILCHVGVVQHARKKTDLALETLNTAITADPTNPLSKFHRASIYFAAGRHAEALEELEELKKAVPKESLVYYLIGKIHKKLGNTHLALMYFSWATDLDPKGASNQIKEAFEPALGRSHESTEEDNAASTSANSAALQLERPDSMHAIPDSDDSL